MTQKLKTSAVKTVETVGATVIAVAVSGTETIDKAVLQAVLRVSALLEAAVVREVAVAKPPNSAVIRLLSAALPRQIRGEYVEERLAYLADLPPRLKRARWIAHEAIGFPRYLYTVRTGQRKESA